MSEETSDSGKPVSRARAVELFDRWLDLQPGEPRRPGVTLTETETNALLMLLHAVSHGHGQGRALRAAATRMAGIVMKRDIDG